MKNLKKLSRSKLKTVFGGGPIEEWDGGNFSCHCGCGIDGGNVESMSQCHCRCKILCDRDTKC